ncbi:hypothetical protein [Pararhizobium qamdonense]|uniref:hypothetical protein n=1 Tax=Pararhizobium qamdonense TaxID=3031126 RepID=UPI0023E34ECE|nr:hypothetical protein [Pararhizobium qamdonense]
MQHILHAHRYRLKMQDAIKRLDGMEAANPEQRLVSQSLLAAEFCGMTEAELRKRRHLLNHLDLLIYDWQNDGCTTYDADNVLNADQDDAPQAYDLLSSLEGDIVYFNFGHRAEMRLANEADGFIEGVYLREAFMHGAAGFEVTIVCGGAAWDRFETIRFGDAMRTASQILIGFVVLDEDFTRGFIPSSLDGDRRLIDDGTLLMAIGLADKMLRILAFGDRVVTINNSLVQTASR